MNAGRDVERLIAGWLVEEAADRAPDRVLDAARRSIDDTSQRRFVAAWREPMYVSPIKVAAAAAVVAIAVIGGAFFGRMTAPSGFAGQPSPAPTATPAPTPDAEALFLAYRDTRDAICERYDQQTLPLRPQFENLYDPGESATERAPKVAALDAFATAYDAMVAELGALVAPPDIAAEHAADVARYDAVAGLIHGIVERLNAGDLAGAESLDLATNPISADISRFETRYVLRNCP